MPSHPPDYPLKCHDKILVDLVLLKNEMSYLRADMARLMKVVVEGNGHSLVSKIAVIESKLRIGIAVLTLVTSSAVYFLIDSLMKTK